MPLLAAAASTTSSSSNKASATSSIATEINANASDAESGGQSSAATSFFVAISMIVVSEIGDKTFLIAALMAMRHNRMIVFLGSISSLFIMTILAGIFGQAFTSFIPEKFIHLCASILFFVFGYKILQEGLAMASGAGVQEEMEEVEEELAIQDLNNANNLREGGAPRGSLYDQSTHKFKAFTLSIKNSFNKHLSPVFVQVFVMVFLGEIGDRSQISTIIMASNGNYWYVIFGSIVGHAICTALAVIGGKYLATKISMKTITLSGAVFFFVFGFVYLYEFFTNED
ncbi:hypothetical protein ACO0QE_002498 [Hanseniaspora vineae]